MLIEIPSPQDVAVIRRFLAKYDYDSENLKSRLGTAKPAAPGEERRMFDVTAEVNVPNLLVRLFLLGGQIGNDIATELIPEEVLKVFFSLQLLTNAGTAVHANVVIIPVENLLFVSDAFRMLGGAHADEFILPASTHSANLLRLLTIRDDVKSTLDLGCGCGIHALFAACHSESVVATDISEAAVRYTEFNARLNEITNVEVRIGSLFEPVADQKFDLIVSNPPFVVAPGRTFVYRDSEMILDEFCRTLVGGATQHLLEDGYLQMLCEWVEIGGEPWQERIADWIRGCDAWILHSAPVLPADYVQQRSEDISGKSVCSGVVSEWNAYLADNRVAAIHPGVLTLRRRTGKNWMHEQRLTGEIEHPVGRVIVEGIGACEFLELCDDTSLLDAILRRSDGIIVDSGNADGESSQSAIRLRLDRGIGTSIEVDSNVEAFVDLHDGHRSIRGCIDAYAGGSVPVTPELQGELLSITRVLVARGFLRPLDFAEAE